MGEVAWVLAGRLRGQGIGEEESRKMAAGRCQGLDVTNIFLFLPCDSQLSVLPKKNLKIWVRKGGGLVPRC